jgi:NADH:ubiquinone oxidoreductase subunit F (NADH-binding)
MRRAVLEPCAHRGRAGALGRLLPPAGTPLSWGAFRERHGALPRVTGRASGLLEAIEASGLRGRGGAGFPTARKLRAVRSRRGAVVVANGVEGEPLSSKDEVLLAFNPHLVIDGLLAAAALVRAEQVIIAVSRKSSAAARVRAALDERPDAARIELALAPDRFVAGEETALVHWLNGGDAKPTTTPPRPFERGVGGRPTLVQNVETLADVALLCRYGPDWFREAGTAAEPGSALATVAGAVARPGVLEVELGSPLHALVERCGGLTAPAQAVLVGGYFGVWIPPQLDTPLSSEGLARHGAALGARALVVLPERTCGVVETARVAVYMARQSAGQCGPCVFGLRAVADALVAIARGRPHAAAEYERLRHLHAQVARRGACAHPDGALAFVASALERFEEEFSRHLAGRCSAPEHRPVLATPPSGGEWR